MSEQPLELRTFLRAIWGRRWMIGALAALGLASGIAHEVVVPPLPTARALVILPPGSLTGTAGAPVDDSATQVIIATSTPVLTPAGEAVSPPIGATALKRQVTVSALSDEVLQVQVSARRADNARKLANAVASDYVTYVDNTGSEGSGNVLSGLQEEASALSKQVQDLQDQVNAAEARLATERPTSANGERDATLASSLRTEQEEVSLQLNNVNDQIVSTELSGRLSAGATRVLEAASLVPASTLGLALYPGTGLFLGLSAGVLVAVVNFRRDRRLRFRDEMASALNVPVLGSLDCEVRKSANDWRRLLEKYQPSSVNAWNLRRLLHSLMPPMDEDRALQLNVVAFADDRPALAAGVQLTRFATELGIQAALVAEDHPSLALLRMACALYQPPGSSRQPVALEGKSAGPEFSAATLTVSVVAFDEAKPTIAHSPGPTVLAVSSGFASAEALAKVALAASDADNSLDGIVVVNPDPNDSTVGMAPTAGEARELLWHTVRPPNPQRSAGQPR
ncbi:MAG: hypothetical protein ACLQVK_03145 [Acidimicrobiales bacterium]